MKVKPITTYLFEKAKGIISEVPEVRDDGRGFTMADSGAVEVEIGELLYAFARVQKPSRILTTGVYTGISDMYLAQALEDNQYGTIDAIEYEIKHIERAQKLWQQVGVSQRIITHHILSLEFMPVGMYDMMVLDTEMHLRLLELVRYFPHLVPGGYVFIHDMPDTLCQDNVNSDHPDFLHWPVGAIPHEVTKWVRNGELRPVFFKNPRSMLAFYKVRPSEYTWT